MAKKKRENSPDPQDFDSIDARPGESDHEEAPSKSAKKRAMTALQDLGEQASALDRKEIVSLQLSDSLSMALCDAGSISAREGKRRHMQFIGKLMRKEPEENIENLRQFLSLRNHNHHIAIQKEKLIERWRERLLTEGDSAIQALVEEGKSIDRGQMRSLIRSARKELADESGRSHYRKLYQQLKSILSE